MLGGKGREGGGDWGRGWLVGCLVVMACVGFVDRIPMNWWVLQICQALVLSLIPSPFKFSLISCYISTYDNIFFFFISNSFR